jgi:hypothetical protein
MVPASCFRSGGVGDKLFITESSETRNNPENFPLDIGVEVTTVPTAGRNPLRTSAVEQANLS